MRWRETAEVLGEKKYLVFELVINVAIGKTMILLELMIKWENASANSCHADVCDTYKLSWRTECTRTACEGEQVRFCHPTGTAWW